MCDDSSLRVRAFDELSSVIRLHPKSIKDDVSWRSIEDRNDDATWFSTRMPLLCMFVHGPKMPDVAMSGFPTEMDLLIACTGVVSSEFPEVLLVLEIDRLDSGSSLTLVAKCAKSEK
jgi:hypothetical protein